jgi:hypothetical protein
LACIDGLSHKLLWLRVGVYNRIPELVQEYYVAAVNELGTIPAQQRSELGDEIRFVAAVQQQINGDNAHLYGRSADNPHIESW